MLLPGRRLTTSLNSKQQDGGVGVDGEGRQHHFVQDVILYPAQLLRQVTRRDEAAGGGPLLAGRDELEGTLQGLLQVLQRTGQRRAVGHRPRLLQLRQDGAEPQHAPRDLVAILLVVANPVHGLLDLEPDFDDLLHGGHRICHRNLPAARSCAQDRADEVRS